MSVHLSKCHIVGNHIYIFVLLYYSALLYLNGDFDGGQFFFAHKNRSEQVGF